MFSNTQAGRQLWKPPSLIPILLMFCSEASRYTFLLPSLKPHLFGFLAVEASNFVVHSKFIIDES
jgi:hypothetical protein